MKRGTHGTALELTNHKTRIPHIPPQIATAQETAIAAAERSSLTQALQARERALAVQAAQLSELSGRLNSLLAANFALERRAEAAEELLLAAQGPLSVAQLPQRPL